MLTPKADSTAFCRAPFVERNVGPGTTRTGSQECTHCPGVGSAPCPRLPRWAPRGQAQGAALCWPRALEQSGLTVRTCNLPGAGHRFSRAHFIHEETEAQRAYCYQKECTHLAGKEHSPNGGEKETGRKYNTENNQLLC